MKRLILTSVLFLLCIIGFAQTDTLFTRKGQKISCKIYEIGESEIKYRLATVLDGPIYVVDKSTVVKYTLSNGFTERLRPDELSLENEHQEIIGNREVIKIHPFGFAFDHITLAYEHVIKVGMNLDVEVGYINSSMTNNSTFGYNTVYNNSGGPAYSVGGYIKPGIKFFLGQDFSVKGLKYAHPLKGRYIKLDFAFSYLNFQNIESVLYGNNPYPLTGPITYTSVTTDLNSIAYGGFVNYGRQFILGNILTLDYYVGLGFTGQSSSYTNPNYLTTINQNYGYYNDKPTVSNYYGFIRVPTIGLSFTAGLRVGYIIPCKKDKKKKTPVTPQEK